MSNRKNNRHFNTQKNRSNQAVCHCKEPKVPELLKMLPEFITEAEIIAEPDITVTRREYDQLKKCEMVCEIMHKLLMKTKSTYDVDLDLMKILFGVEPAPEGEEAADE